MGRQFSPIQSLTVKASGALVQNRFVKFDGAQAGVQGEKVLGVAEFNAADTELATVGIAGTVVVEAGAAIAVGDSVITNASGKAIPVTGALAVASGATPVTSSAANGAILQGADLPDFVAGDALEAAAADGDFIEVLLRR